MHKFCTSQSNGPSKCLTIKGSDWVLKFKVLAAQWAGSVDHKPMFEAFGVECMMTVLGLASILHSESLHADGAFAVVFIDLGHSDRVVLHGSL